MIVAKANIVKEGTCMKRRRLARALIMLLCIAVLLSGTLLILHTRHDHMHRVAECPVCMALERRAEASLCILSMLAIFGMIGSLALCGFNLGENRFLPDWTPVRRKVKLLD